MRPLSWPQARDGESAERTINRVFAWARDAFAWRDDQQIWGSPEYWATSIDLEAQFAQGFVLGDCDDFSGLCLHALRTLGIEARYLTCWVEDGGYHCVCLARENGNAWVLDNRQPVVCTLDELTQRVGYVFDRISGAMPHEDWTRAA